jgi:hypothetical protein
MKSGVVQASSNSTSAQTLPKWGGKRLILSSDWSGWTILERDCRTSEILFPVRYFVIPFLFTNTANGSESDWSSLLAHIEVLYAAHTGHISGWHHQQPV